MSEKAGSRESAAAITLISVILLADIPGSAPSVQPLCEQKLYSVVSAPAGVILKTVPQPPPLQSVVLAPPSSVVP